MNKENVVQLQKDIQETFKEYLENYRNIKGAPASSLLNFIIMFRELEIAAKTMISAPGEDRSVHVKVYEHCSGNFLADNLAALSLAMNMSEEDFRETLEYSKTVIKSLNKTTKTYLDSFKNDGL